MDPMTIFMVLVLIVLIVVMIVQRNKRKRGSNRNSASPNSHAILTSKTSVEGYNGQVNFDGSQITISRNGAVAKMTFGSVETKAIPLSDIISIEFKPSSGMLNGYIQFRTASSKAVATLSEASHDEHAVVFTKAQSSQFFQLKKSIEA